MADAKPKNVPGEVEYYRMHASVLVLFWRLVVVIIGITVLAWLFSVAINGNAVFRDIRGGLIILPFLIGIFISLIIFLSWWTTVFRVTNKRVEMHFGIIGYEENQIGVSDIQKVEVRKSFFGVLFNYGNVTIHSAARGQEEIVFNGISRPKKVANKIEDLAAL